MKSIFAITAAAAAMQLALSGISIAQTSVSATTDLNVRAGPGPQHPVIGVIGAGQSTTLNGCLKSGKWCSVATANGEGWVYSDYLTGDFGGTRVILTERPADSVKVVEPADKGGGDAGAVAGGVTGAVAGALIAGPVGAAVGGAAGVVAGGAAGTVIDPPEKVRTYVTTNKIDPIYLDGEVVVGAGLPETVELREIPDYEYRYVYVNGQPVLVDAKSRQIVYIVR
ncbi:DUF1236 domain-containing protein [Aminobacter anthyllidis]|uniref:DUF1236 domain-containing protein n=1 Tax=Aminobacter anthyllidis TaxID=1035067 RepID=A0A9X1AIP8_9HYPH|nr:DUF1236 domain-containing protein [Aminobacter anthyllidis]MBT1160198.1 DUF1236 domain-containing protein [Aminobacter anthyllidis]